MTLIRKFVVASALLALVGSCLGKPVDATDTTYVPTTTAPANPCRYDPQVPATDPTCPPPCQYNPDLPADDPYCEDSTNGSTTTWPDSTSIPTSTLPPTSSTPTTILATTTTVLGDTSGSSTTTTSPTSSSTSPPTSPVVSVGEPPVPPTTVCDPALTPTCNRLPVTGSSNYTVVPYALVIAALGALLVLAARRKQAA